MIVIKDTLLRAFEGDRYSINKLCSYFRNVALAYLKTKTKEHRLLLNLLYTDLEDLALDCIADLFQKEGESLPQLEAYFQDHALAQMDEAKLVSEIRRLVFSKVNEGLYRNYKSFDPSLSKIIRNLKRTLEEEKVPGVSYNRSSSQIELDGVNKRNKPVMPEEWLEIKLSAELKHIGNSVEALEQLKYILQRNEQYAASVQLVAFAIILRKSFAYQLEEQEATKKSIAEMNFRQEEIKTFIALSIEKLKPQLAKTYVQSGKLTAFTLEKYVKAVSDILVSEFSEKSSREGHFEHVEYHFPEITYRGYRQTHRKFIEYLTQKIRQEFLLTLKKEEYFSKNSVWQ